MTAFQTVLFGYIFIVNVVAVVWFCQAYNIFKRKLMVMQGGPSQQSF